MDQDWIDWKELFSYFISFCCWVGGSLPSTCDGWTKLVGLTIATLTLFFITLPKCWPNIKKFLGVK